MHAESVAGGESARQRARLAPSSHPTLSRLYNFRQLYLSEEKSYQNDFFSSIISETLTYHYYPFWSSPPPPYPQFHHHSSPFSWKTHNPCQLAAGSFHKPMAQTQKCPSARYGPNQSVGSILQVIVSHAHLKVSGNLVLSRTPLCLIAVSIVQFV